MVVSIMKPQCMAMYAAFHYRCYLVLLVFLNFANPGGGRVYSVSYGLNTFIGHLYFLFCDMLDKYFAIYYMGHFLVDS